MLRALLILEAHPLIARRFDDHLRELVISRGKRDVVRVLALRHQREAGYLEE